VIALPWKVFENCLLETWTVLEISWFYSWNISFIGDRKARFKVAIFIYSTNGEMGDCGIVSEYMA